MFFEHEDSATFLGSSSHIAFGGSVEQMDRLFSSLHPRSGSRVGLLKFVFGSREGDLLEADDECRDESCALQFGQHVGWVVGTWEDLGFCKE